MSEKIIGYLLLSVGLIIMVFSLINIYMVFTGRAKPISVIKAIDTTAKTGSDASENATPAFDITAMFPNLPEEQAAQLRQLNAGSGSGANPMAAITGSMLSPSMINDVIALSTHFLLITVLMGFGHKLATLGTNLLKPIHVTLDRSKIPTVD